MRRARLATGLLFQAVGLALHIAGVSTDEWSTVDIRGATVTGGLWEYCPKFGCDDWPSEIEEFFDERLDVVRAFAIIGMLVAVIAISFQIRACRNVEEEPLFSIVAGGVAFLAFVAIMISVIVWGAAIRHNIGTAVKQLSPGAEFEIELGYSFILSTIGAGLLLISALVDCEKNVKVKPEGGIEESCCGD